MSHFSIEQYKTLREEISERQARKFKIMTAGLFGVPALLLAGRYFENQVGLGEIFFSISPIVVIITAFIYVAENNGVMRAGAFIRTVIEPEFSHEVHGWEGWLEENIDKGTRDVDKTINVSFFAVAVLYYIGSIGVFYAYADPLFGVIWINRFAYVVYTFFAVKFLRMAFVKAKYSTNLDG